MNSRQVEGKHRKDIYIDSELHRLLKIEASRAQMTIRDLLEGYIAEILNIERKL